jgi:PAB-dependent poly(A)-specific ribonuclease subunit 3
VYKAVSAKDGQTYALRRLEGFRLTNVDAMRGVKKWKGVLNGGVVTIHDAFTTRAFGDSSLIVVTDYHACSKSLTEEHFRGTGAMVSGRGSWNAGPAGRGVVGGGMGGVPEATLWGYIVQISSALKAIHSVGLAARLLTPSKILLTSKNRIRLNACAIMDVVSFSSTTSTPDLQTEDLLQLGRLILAIATGNMSAHLTMAKSLEQISRAYTARLRETITWLLAPSSVLIMNPNPTTPTSITSPSQIPAPVTPTSPTTPVLPIVKDIDTFLAGISDQFALVFDSTLHAQDTLTSTLAKELESSRLVRLLIKLNMINERPELSQEPGSSGTTPASSAWAETGERYYLKLFRDYVFHQVDASGRPVTDLSHVLECLNKLDAGSDEKVALVSRDEQNVLVVTYREVKRGLEGAFQEVVKAGQQRR